MKGIRLTDLEVIEICKIFRECFAINDHIWLFGSRTDLSKKGGDIDLYIETNLDINEINKCKSSFLMKLEKKLGEQKIDVVIKSSNLELPIYNEAKKEGIRLL